MSFSRKTPDPVVFPMPRHELHQWLSCPSGKMLLSREKALLDGVLPHLFGHYILQVGRLGDADLLVRSRIPHRILVEVDGNRSVPGRSCLRARPDALPVVSDSIDVVVLPHLLEFSSHIQETIQEAERVLIAEGHLLILAFNAWSLLGIHHLLCRQGNPDPDRQSESDERPCTPCRGGRFPGLNRIRNRIATLGFEVISVKRYFFQPPIGNRDLMNRLRFLDVIGPRFLPFFSGAYLIVAKKRVTTLTPIRLHRRQPRQSLIPVGLSET